MGKKILVSGATGFVGRALCARLAAEGNDVIGIGRSAQSRVPQSFVYYPLDLEKKDPIAEIFRDVDSVIHLAGKAHRKGENGKQQLDAFRSVNVDGSLRLARAAIENGVRTFVFVSSIGVHGTVTNSTAISESTPFCPDSPYAVSKMEAELKLANLFEATAVSDLTIVRPPLVYGVDAPGNFASLLRLTYSPTPLPFGGCINRRSLISLESLVDVLISCIKRPAKGNQSFVVSDSSAISTREIVSSLRAGMGLSNRLIFIPPVLMSGTLRLVGKREMYNQLFCNLEIDNRKATNMLGWAACEDTKEELRSVGKHYADSRL